MCPGEIMSVMYITIVWGGDLALAVNARKLNQIGIDSL